MSTREDACQALFAIASAAYAWQNTPTRRLKMWNDVPKELRPAMYQFEGAPETWHWSNLLNPIRRVDVKLFCYFAASDAAPGAPQINAALEAIDTALRPVPGDQWGRQTGGDTAFQMRIRGVPIKEPGDLDNDAMLVVEVEIILP